jgi:hypothetical protein
MEHQQLAERLPNLAQAEQKTIEITDPYLVGTSGGSVPAGSYEIQEAYCPLPNCDCQRVTLSVYSQHDQQTKASISFGWETFMYYAGWFNTNNPDSLQRIKGPVLVSERPQSPIAQNVLSMVTDLALSDPEYIESLKKHYRLFKADVKKAGKKAGASKKKAGKKR